MKPARQRKVHEVSDIEIAQANTMKPISEISAMLGIDSANLEPYGHYKAKVSLKYLDSLPLRPQSKLILVTAISPETERNKSNACHEFDPFSRQLVANKPANTGWKNVNGKCRPENAP